MKKNTPMPLSGGTYRAEDGVLSRDDDTAPAAPAEPSTEKPLRSRTQKPQQLAGPPARKR